MNSAKNLSSVFEIGDSDLLRLLDRPRPVNVDRNRPFDERSYSDVSVTASARHGFRSPETLHSAEHLDYLFSPGIRSGLNTARLIGYYESHPMIAVAWEALRKSVSVVSV